MSNMITTEIMNNQDRTGWDRPGCPPFDDRSWDLRNREISSIPQFQGIHSGKPNTWSAKPGQGKIMDIPQTVSTWYWADILLSNLPPVSAVRQLSTRIEKSLCLCQLQMNTFAMSWSTGSHCVSFTAQSPESLRSSFIQGDWNDLNPTCHQLNKLEKNTYTHYTRPPKRKHSAQTT